MYKQPMSMGIPRKVLLQPVSFASRSPSDDAPSRSNVRLRVLHAEKLRVTLGHTQRSRTDFRPGKQLVFTRQ